MMKELLFTGFLISSICIFRVEAKVQPAQIFHHNMVVQRDKPVRIWGTADPNEKVTVEFSGQKQTTTTDLQGEWYLYLEKMATNAEPSDMKITGKDCTVIFNNVLVGDVWILGGQSNMEFDLARIFHGDVEILSAHFPEIRLMTIPSSANQKPKKDFQRINEYDAWYDRYDKKGYWFVCSPLTVPTYSALGYIFGRRLYMASQVPIGLVDVSMGGTTVEAWLSPETLEEMPENDSLLQQWKDKVAAYDPEESLKTRIENWEKRSAARREQGLETGPKPTEPAPDPAYDRNFPGSSYTGMIAPIKGLTVKGAIFHQGYNNALGDARPKQYAINFKALIDDWRTAFLDDNMPFGIIGLSAGGEPQTLENHEVSMIDAAPYIREAQFRAFLDRPNTGFVCSYDQQVNWYHPQKKLLLGERIARWALSTQYGYDLDWEPAVVTGVERLEDRIVVSFDREIKSSDDRPFEGFSIAGSDRHFFPASTEYVEVDQVAGRPVYDKSRIEIWSDQCVDPLEVRYAWARNPLGNLINLESRTIPVPSFRTDSWDYPEAPYLPVAYEAHRESMRTLREEAKAWAETRNKSLK